VIITPDQIPEYQEYSGLKNIACRAVLSNPGEYHVKSLCVSINTLRLIHIISGMIDETELTIIDPDNLLKLEWTVAMKVNSIFVNECIEEYLKRVDDYLEGIKNEGL
jgi:hypothetical protein